MRRTYEPMTVVQKIKAAAWAMVAFILVLPFVVVQLNALLPALILVGALSTVFAVVIGRSYR